MNRGRHRRKQHLIVQILGTAVSNRMMECQKNCGNLPNLDVFLTEPTRSAFNGGFNWSDTEEGFNFWDNILGDTFNNHPLYKRYKNDWR